MPTNDERRKVADRLREWTNVPSQLWDGADIQTIINDCVSSEPLSKPGLLAKLADLIEPEPERTCHNVANDPKHDFRCSYCRFGYADTFARCPCCGAKVVEHE